MPRPNGRDPETDPAAFLGDELRRARISAGYPSQESLAAELGFDRSVVTKIETGERPPTPDVLARWCKVCHLDYEQFARMATLARRADGPVPRWFESWLDAEGRATMLRYWSPIIVPALFNTADYARALLLAAQTDTSDDAIDALVEAKLKRQVILDRRDPPEVVTLIDEMVLHRLIGSPEIMYEQLLHVAELPRLAYVSVQVIPTAVGATAGLSGSVSLASVDGTVDVLHTDAVPEGHTTESRSLVCAAAVAFERMRQHALPHSQSRELILKVAEEKWNV
jgi:transcriptional regulator with XRE-family HTH domain